MCIDTGQMCKLQAPHIASKQTQRFGQCFIWSHPILFHSVVAHDCVFAPDVTYWVKYLTLETHTLRVSAVCYCCCWYKTMLLARLPTRPVQLSTRPLNTCTSSLRSRTRVIPSHVRNTSDGRTVSARAAATRWTNKIVSLHLPCKRFVVFDIWKVTSSTAAFVASDELPKMRLLYVVWQLMSFFSLTC